MESWETHINIIRAVQQGTKNIELGYAYNRYRKTEKSLWQRVHR